MLFKFDVFLVSGPHGNGRPVLSWQKAYQKRTLSISSDMIGSNDQSLPGLATSENKYPVALRVDRTKTTGLLASSTDEKCETAGFLEYISYSNGPLIERNENNRFAIKLDDHAHVYIPTNTLTISTIFLAAVIIIFLWYFKQYQLGFARQESMMTETTSSAVSSSPPSTPLHFQSEQSITPPPFQSR